MTRTSFAVTAALFLAASSCEKEKASESTPATAASAASASSATPTGASAAPAAAPNEAESIPVAADFEEEAEKTINKANYKSELDALEAELKK
jgi:type III secretory pathway component EscV